MEEKPILMIKENKEMARSIVYYLISSYKFTHTKWMG